MRRTTSTVLSSPQKCIDKCRFPLLFKISSFQRTGSTEYRVCAFTEVHNSSFPLSPHTLSLYIDTKIVLAVNCSGSHSISVIIFWISVRICNVVNPVKFSTRTPSAPSIRSNSRHWDEFINQLIFSFRNSSHAQYRIGEYIGFRC